MIFIGPEIRTREKHFVYGLLVSMNVENVAIECGMYNRIPMRNVFFKALSYPFHFSTLVFKVMWKLIYDLSLKYFYRKLRSHPITTCSLWQTHGCPEMCVLICSAQLQCRGCERDKTINLHTCLVLISSPQVDQWQTDTGLPGRVKARTREGALWCSGQPILECGKRVSCNRTVTESIPLWDTSQYGALQYGECLSRPDSRTRVSE